MTPKIEAYWDQRYARYHASRMTACGCGPVCQDRDHCRYSIKCWTREEFPQRCAEWAAQHMTRLAVRDPWIEQRNKARQR